MTSHHTCMHILCCVVGLPLRKHIGTQPDGIYDRTFPVLTLYVFHQYRPSPQRLLHLTLVFATVGNITQYLSVYRRISTVFVQNSF